VLGSERSQPVLLAIDDRLDMDESKPKRGRGHKERRRASEAIGDVNVRRVANPGASDALSIVNGYRHVFGFGVGLRHPAIEKVEEIPSRIRT
jgi:hypothetical protein